MANKELSGALFKNGRKEKDTHPDMTGSAMINGVEYWVSAWKKDGNKGPYVSLAFKVKEPRQGGGSQGGSDPLDDTIPF